MQAILMWQPAHAPCTNKGRGPPPPPTQGGRPYASTQQRRQQRDAQRAQQLNSNPQSHFDAHQAQDIAPISVCGGSSATGWMERREKRPHRETRNTRGKGNSGQLGIPHDRHARSAHRPRWRVRRAREAVVLHPSHFKPIQPST